MEEDLRFVQLVVGQYIDDVTPLTYSIVGLTKEGYVYRYSHRAGGWVLIPPNEAE